MANSVSFSIFLKDYFSKPLNQVGKTSDRVTGRMSKGFKDTGNDAQTAGKKIGGMANPMQKIMQLAAGFGLAFGFTSIISSAIRMSDEFQRTNVAMGVMLGSTEKATKMVMGLEKFALATPFTPQQLNKSAQMMLGFGIAAEKIIPNVKMLGDIAQGDENKLNMLSLAFSQSMAAGKLMGQDLLQMINAGFNPLKVIAEKTGKSIGFLKDEMSKGAITSEIVEEAFKSATAKGGLYNGMMEKISKTYGGKLSTAQGNWNKLLQLMGDKITDGLLPSLDAFNGSWRKMIPVVEKIGSIIAWVAQNMDILGVVMGIMAVAKIGALVASMTTLGIVTKLVTVGQWLLNVALTANPIGLVIAAVAALAGAFYLLWTRSETFRGVLMGIYEVLKPFGQFLWKVAIFPIQVLIKTLGAIWDMVSPGLTKFYNFLKDKIGGVFTWMGEKIEQFLGFLAEIPMVGAAIAAFQEGFKKGAIITPQTKAAAGADNVAGDDGKGFDFNKALNFGGADGKGSKKSNTGIGLSGVKGDGQVSKNITVNIDKLVESLNLTSETVTEGVGNIRDMVAEALTNAVRDVELSY